MKSAFSRLKTITVWLAIAIAVPVLFVRCTPQWSADSQSFVVVSGDGTIMIHNIKTKQTQKLPKKVVPTSATSFNAKADKVFCAEFFFEKEKQTTLKISSYDLAGKLLHSSPKHQFQVAENNGGGVVLPLCYVSEDEKHVVASVPFGLTTVVYDVEKKSFKNLEKVVPLMSVTAPGLIQFSQNPFTRDGKGFVLFSADQDGADIGWAQFSWGDEEPARIAIPKDLFQKFENAMQGEKTPSVVTDWRWEMGVATMMLQEGKFQVNPRTKSVKWLKSRRSEKLYQHALDQEVRVIGLLDQGIILQVNQDGMLQTWDPRNPTQTPELEELMGEGLAFLSISPDRKKVMVRSMRDAGVIAVYGIDGSKLTEIKVPIAGHPLMNMIQPKPAKE